MPSLLVTRFLVSLGVTDLLPHHGESKDNETILVHFLFFYFLSSSPHVFFLSVYNIIILYQLVLALFIFVGRDSKRAMFMLGFLPFACPWMIVFFLSAPFLLCCDNIPPGRAECLVFFIGEEVWRYVGKLTDAQRSMLDDRFKWKVCLYFTCINVRACAKTAHTPRIIEHLQHIDA